MSTVYRGHRHAARPPGRDQGDGSAAGRRPRLPHPVRARGPLRGPDRPPRCRRRPRPGQRPRPAPAWSPLLFLVMELVEGGTLRDVLRARGAVGVPAAFAVMEQVLSGLAAAHRLGLVHRDVKPENVLISRAGEVKVADFGLVTASAQAGASTAGMIMGTVAYLSPEQVATGAADARSDVYAAGIAALRAAHRRAALQRRHRDLGGLPARELRRPAAVADRRRRAPRSWTSSCCAPPGATRPPDRPTPRRCWPSCTGWPCALEVPRVPPPGPPARPLEEQDTDPPAPHRTGRAMRSTRRPPAPGGTAPDVARPATARRRTVRGARRSRRIFAVWTAIVLVLALLVGVTAWWLGSGRWTAMPIAAGLDRSGGAAGARRRRPRRARHRGARRRGRRRAASAPPTRPRRPGCCAAAPCRSRSRPAARVPEIAPGTTAGGGRAGHARRGAHPRAGDRRRRVQRRGARRRGRADRSRGRHRAAHRRAGHDRGEQGRGAAARRRGAVPHRRGRLDDAVDELGRRRARRRTRRRRSRSAARTARVVDQDPTRGRGSTPARRSCCSPSDRRAAGRIQRRERQPGVAAAAASALQHLRHEERQLQRLLRCSAAGRRPSRSGRRGRRRRSPARRRGTR